MWPQRRIPPLLSLLLLAASLACLAGYWANSTYGPHRLVAGRWYAVDATGETASLDLSFADGERYLLVVNSLGTATTPHRITLTSQAPGERSTLPVRPLEPLSSEVALRPADQPDTPGTVRGPSVASPPAVSRDFFLHVTEGPLEDPKSYVRAACRLVGEGERIRVYLDGQVKQSELSPGLVDEIVHIMDCRLLPAMDGRFGRTCDVDGDGKFAIVLSPWLSRLQGGRTSLGGFVRSSDFRSDLEAPFSNRCDVMYLNSTLTPGLHLDTLLAHEYTHAVCCSLRIAGGRGRPRLPEEDDWLNEAIAHLSENLFAEGWSNLDHRVNDFLNEPGAYPLVVGDYYRAGLWRNHGCRGATYLFLRWCVDQFGEECLTRLVRGQATGARNVEMATGVAFQELFRHWSIALADDGTHEVPNAFQSVDLCGKVGQWSLAGSQIQRYDVSAASLQLDLAGTSSAFVELRDTDRRGGLRRIQITAESGSGLQVSIQKRPQRRPRLDVAARWLPANGRSADGHGGEDMQPIAVKLAMQPASDFEVEAVSVEARGPQPSKQFRFEGARLATAAESWRHSTQGSAAARGFVLPLPGGTDLQKGCVIKVVVRDEAGQRTTARWSLGAADEWLSQFAFADIDATSRTQ